MFEESLLGKFRRDIIVTSYYMNLVRKLQIQVTVSNANILNWRKRSTRLTAHWYDNQF